MNLTQLWQIASFVANAPILDATVQGYAEGFWGKRLRAYVGGVDTFNADTPEERFPYICAVPVSTDSTNGNRTSIVRAEIAVRADAWRDSTKPPLREAGSMPLEVGCGSMLSVFADAVEDSIRAANLGAVLEGVRAEMDLQNQYPVQTVTFEIELSDTMTF